MAPFGSSFLLPPWSKHFSNVSVNFATFIAALTGTLGFILGRWSSRKPKALDWRSPSPAPDLPLLCGSPSLKRRTTSLCGERNRGETDEPDWVRMRFIHINDVYTLENLPKLKMLLDEYSNMIPSTNVVVSIGGDLLSPYPLSALDQGKGMVDVLLRADVRYAIFGNHEADVGVKALKARVKEWQKGGGIWLNTNMPDLLPELELPRHTRKIGYSKNQEVSRCVELLGVCSNDPNLYVGNLNFGGAINTAGDCNKTALSWANALKSGQTDENGTVDNVDAVVVLTHQDTEPDRALANEGKAAGIYLVLGGHDHNEYLEEHNGCVMAKAGADAHKAVVADLLWRSPEDEEPEIAFYDLVPVSGTASKAVTKEVDKHMEQVRAFDREKAAMALTTFPDEPLVSSRGIRESQTEMGYILCTALRDELGVDCVLFDAGNIRGDRDYKPVQGHYCGNQWAFTMADLENEVPYASPMVEIMMRGDDIARAVHWSRTHKGKFGGFLQTDRGVLVSPEDQAQVICIGERQLEKSRPYRVGLMYNSLVGMNGHPVLKEWRESPANVNHLPPEDAGRPAKVLLLRYFARMTWKSMPPFREMVKLAGKEQTLSLETIRQAYIQAHPQHQKAADAMARRLLAVADTTGDGLVSKEEIETLFPLPRWMTLMVLPNEPLISSKRVREEQTTMGYLLCDAICKELDADCCLFDGGNIRGYQDYVPTPGHRRGKFWHFTLLDLGRELPWPSEMVVIRLQGKDINDAVCWSRSPSRNKSAIPFGGFLQSDSSVHVEEQGSGEVKVTQVADKPLEPESFYNVALIHTTLEGMNEHPIFARWREQESNRVPPPGMTARMLVVRHYTRLIWATMPDFENIDKDNNGEIGWRELHKAVREKFMQQKSWQRGEATVEEIVRRLLSTALDLNSHDRFSKDEYLRFTRQASAVGGKVTVLPPFFSDACEGESSAEAHS